MFQKGQTIRLKGGKTVTINGQIGQGGQGIVYDVSMNGKKYALKWYLPEYLNGIDQNGFYKNLLHNQIAGAPSKEFLWPIAVSEYQKDSFGYLMELRPNRFCEFTKILNAKKKITSVKTQLVAAKNICKAFQLLHKRGYSYQDINDGNFFIDVNVGDVLVCDNDNVAPCGTWMGMNGKDRYMAPEVVLGKKHAGMESDLYSLSVLLFMLFFIAHPLEGKAVHECPCLTTKYIRKFYAQNPIFVYDPNNARNRPVRGVDNNVISLWKCYPESLRKMFIRAFTKGLQDASYRIRENEWIECIDGLQDLLVTCPYCGGEQFHNAVKNDRIAFVCEDCKKEIHKPFIWEYKRITKNLMVGEQVQYRHIGIQQEGCIGRVIESKKHLGLWGIVNLSNFNWNATFSNGKQLEIKTNQVLPLFRDTKITICEKNINISI